MLETPRSKSTPSTWASPWSASTSAISSYTACTRVTRSPKPASRCRLRSSACGVAVDADDAGLGAAGEDRLGVAAEPEGGVDEDRAGSLQRRRDERDDPVEQHRDVGGSRSSVLSRPAPGRG